MPSTAKPCAARGLRRIHIVSARLDDGLLVGQAAVGAKTNELTAIPQLLGDLELEGRVVTLDPLGCQTDIAEMITEAGGWYLLAVKDNRPNCTTTCATTSPTSTALPAWAVTTVSERLCQRPGG